MKPKLFIGSSAEALEISRKIQEILEEVAPYSPSLPAATETRKITKKKPAFTVSRSILESKGLTFENRNKTICFLSVFSVLIYIFEEITIATN